MSKYIRLNQHLKSLQSQEWSASFEEIEKILGFSLPASAYEYQAWWANQTGGGHIQSASWQEAGWRTANLDLNGRTVTFSKQPVNAFAEYRSPSPSMRSTSTDAVVNAFGSVAKSTPSMELTNAFANSVKDNSVSEQVVRPLTIAQAKAGLSVQFGIPTDCIEIIIKG